MGSMSLILSKSVLSISDMLMVKSPSETMSPLKISFSPLLDALKLINGVSNPNSDDSR
jgi:hypothetical protein